MTNSDGTARIGVVVVAYASHEFLGACVSGVLADASVSQVVVVDNSSDELSRVIVEALAAIDDRVHYVDPGMNLGFARGCNVGVATLGSCTHIFFVNPDVHLQRPLVSLVDSLDAAPQVITAGRLRSPGHPASLNARPLVSRRRELLRAFIGTRAYRMKMAGDRPVDVGQVDGALLGMSATTYSLLGGFDERFELYYEDVDICARAREFGGCMFVPIEWGLHVGGASSSAVSELAYCLGAVSRVRYLRKHFTKSRTTTLLIAVLALVEFSTRSLTIQSEGIAARVRAVRLQMQELASPNSVVLLG